MNPERCFGTRPHIPGRAGCWAWPRTAVWLAAAALSFWLSGQGASRGDLFTFDAVEEFDDNFLQKAPGERLAWSAGPGLGGDPGRVDLRRVEGGPLVFKRPVRWHAWESISAQAYFYYDTENTPSRGGNLAAVGVLGDETGWLWSVDAVPYLSVSVVSLPSEPQSARLGLRSKALPAESFQSLGSSAFDLSTSGWYRIGGTWTLAEGAAIQFAARLFWHGIDGREPGREIASFAGTLLNPDMASDSSMFVGVDAALPAVPYLDNIWIIPEPSGSALAALAALALCARLRGIRRSRPPNGS